MTKKHTEPDNQQKIFSLIKAISGQANILTIPVVFVKMLKGNHRAALLLSQSIYWSDRSSYPDGWFHKSYPQWQAEIGLNQHAVNTAVRVLSTADLLETKIDRVGIRDTLFYRPKLEKVAVLVESTLAETARVTLAESAMVPKRKTLGSSIRHRLPAQTTLPADAGEKDRDLYYENTFRLCYGQAYSTEAGRMVTAADKGKLGKLRQQIETIGLTPEQIRHIWTYWQKYDYRALAAKAHRQPIPRPKIQQVTEILSAAALWIQAGMPANGVIDDEASGTGSGSAAGKDAAGIGAAVLAIQQRAARRATA